MQAVGSTAPAPPSAATLTGPSLPAANPAPRIHRAVALYVRGIEMVAIGATVVLALLAALQVFFRYALGESLFWSEELMRYLMIWVAYLVAGLAYSRGEMLGMRFVVDAASPRLRRAIDLAGRLLVVAFLLVVAVYGFEFAWRTREQEAVALEISLAWIHASVPAGAVLLAVHVLFSGLFAGVLPREGADAHALEAQL